MFMLKPCPITRAIIAFCIFEAALLHGISVHAITVMSNHVHIVFTDHLANHPLFTKHAFAEIAKALNAHWGHTGSFWERAKRPSPQHLVTRAAVVEAMAYTLANPAEAGLVETSTQWPGLVTNADDILTGKRYLGNVGPSKYLASRKVKELTMAMTLPKGVGDAETFVADVRREHLAIEKAARDERHAKRKTVLGAQAAMAQDWWQRPKTSAKIGKMNPAIKAVTKEERIAAILALKAWRKAYHDALLVFCEGDRAVAFPEGTWRMKQLFNCNIAPPACAA
jgi:putative transposase